VNALHAEVERISKKPIPSAKWARLGFSAAQNPGSNFAWRSAEPKPLVYGYNAVEAGVFAGVLEAAGVAVNVGPLKGQAAVDGEVVAEELAEQALVDRAQALISVDTLPMHVEHASHAVLHSLRRLLDDPRYVRSVLRRMPRGDVDWSVLTSEQRESDAERKERVRQTKVDRVVTRWSEAANTVLSGMGDFAGEEMSQDDVDDVVADVHESAPGLFRADGSYTGSRFVVGSMLAAGAKRVRRRTTEGHKRLLSIPVDADATACFWWIVGQHDEREANRIGISVDELREAARLHWERSA
jgi:hypothetical protein